MVSKIRVLIALTLVLGLAAISLQAASVAGQAPGNLVGGHFITNWDYNRQAGTFTNSEVAGRKWWAAHRYNTPDGTGQPVTVLHLRLDSGLAFDRFAPPAPTEVGPPTYRWSFGDVPEGSDAIGRGAFADEGASPSRLPQALMPPAGSTRPSSGGLTLRP